MAEEKRFGKIGQMKDGSYVLIDGFPCRIVEFEKSKPGKHGAAKARITAMGLFDDQKRTLLKPTSDDGEIPIVERSNAQIIAIMGESMQIMDLNTYEQITMPVPKDVEGLANGDEVEYIRYGTSIRILRKKSGA